MEPFGVYDPSLLNKIHQLFECNVGDLISLPQIVFVGDQSSGKSSVLEGLTGIPFPRGSGLCTRFATQIIFRGAKAPLITASIVPANNSTKEHKDKLQRWKKRGLDSFDRTSFENIMAEVTQVMGIQSSEQKGVKSFSNDVFRLEIAGPDQEPFSVIDVPGIFKRTTLGLTTKEDMAMVDNLVRDYMSNPRSVMLVVIPCNVDIATQEILQRAEDLDPKGIRTFGILTKPDLVDKGSESSIVSLIEGKTHQLRLGWHLLRNPGQADLMCSLQERRDTEQNFFRDENPWNTLDEGKLGIVSLRSRLHEILGDHIRREFPKVKAEISKMLYRSEQDLKALGQRRQSQTEQCQYLMDMALYFQSITAHAVYSNYNRSEIFNKNKKLRIATEAVNRGQKFADAMKSFGHMYDFNCNKDFMRENEESVEEETFGLEGPRSVDDGYEEEEEEEQENVEEEGQLSDDEETDRFVHLMGALRCQIRLEDDHIDIQDVVQERTKVSKVTKKDILSWLRKEYRESRGFELGTFDTALLNVVMKEQAAKWRGLALGYISDIISLVHSFILGVLDYITPNSRVREGIRTNILEDMTKMYRNAISQTEFLISVELDGTPATYDPYFNETREKIHQRRTQSRSEGYSQLSSEDNTVLQIYEILQSYYEIARKRFVDCLRMQVADTLLVTGSNTPLTLFSAKFVTNMTPEALEDVAGEDVAMKRRREELEKKLNQLREGKKIIG